MSPRTQTDQPPRSWLGGGKAMSSSQRAMRLKCFDTVVWLSRAYSKESISTQTESMKLSAYICIHCMLEGQKGATKGWQPAGVSGRQKAQWARQSIELKGAGHPYPSSWKKMACKKEFSSRNRKWSCNRMQEELEGESVGQGTLDIIKGSGQLTQLVHVPLSPSSTGSLVPLHFLSLQWCHLHIWGCRYFSQLSWFQLGIYPAWHFTLYTLYIS